MAACLIPAIVLAAVLLHDDYQRSRARLVRDSLDAARALMLAVDGEFRSSERTLHALSTSPSISNRDYAAFHAQSARALVDSNINNITLIDPGGQQLMNTATPFGQPLPKALNISQFESVRTTGRASISNLLVGPVLNRPVVRVVVPVRNGPDFQYLVGVMLPTYLQKLLIERRFGAGRIAVIADASGTVVARTHEIDRFIGKPVAPALLERLNQEDENTFELVSLEGIPVLTAFVRSPTSRWTVAIGTPVDSLTADLWRSLWLLGALAALLLSSALGIAWVMGGRIARSVRTLSASALALGDGQAVAVPALAIREADEVGKAISNASLMLARADEALRGSEARMRGIVLSAMDAIIMVDDNQSIVLFNPAAAAMFGCSVEKAVGLPATRFIPERFHARHHDFVQQQQVHGDNFGEFGVVRTATGKRADGEEFSVEMSYSSLVESGAAYHTFIIRDSTERIRAYEALERSNLDLQQFAFVASHDLKTPLRSIGGFLQIFERNYADKLDEKAQSLIRRASAAVHRLDQLTEDLLSYARVNSEVRPFAPVNCRDMAEEVVHLLDAALRHSRAQVTMGELPEVMGDRTQLVQLLLNLVGNGIKYCRDREPRVHIEAQRDPQGWVFSVADNGIGIDARHHEKIFEVFKRLHTQNEYAGTGIGLAVCRRVVERHGGKIWITSVVGEGSTFHFTIPNIPAERAVL